MRIRYSVMLVFPSRCRLGPIPLRRTADAGSTGIVTILARNPGDRIASLSHAGDLGSLTGRDDDPGGHEQEESDLAEDGRGAAAQPHVQPQDPEADGDDGISRGDDRLDRREERAPLECVLNEDEAS